jgi:hypothetical protein
MGDRYWVGGTGTWSSTNTLNWSLTVPLSFTASRSGTTLTTVGSPAIVPPMEFFDATGVHRGLIISGSVNTWTTNQSGTITSQTCVASTQASVPTAADNVFFNATSNGGVTAFTVTMANTPRLCNDFTASGLDGAMTLAGAAIGLTVSGSLTFQATNFSATYTGTTTFNATTTGKTVTTNGVAFGGGGGGAVTFDGVGGGWTLGSALSFGVANPLTLTNGTFDTSASNYAVSGQKFLSSNSNARTINLNNSTLTFTTSGSAWDMPTTTNATLNAGNSTIICSSATTTFAGGGLTYYNVSFTSTALTTPSITGANTFNNLSITGRTTVGIGLLSLSANQTINGTLTVSAGTASAFRIFIASDTLGTTRTLTCAAVSLTDTDFRDITIAGAASPATGTRLGDAKGNTNITFGAAKTVFYRQTGSANWGATGTGSWSATSGGALDATQFPLAQDTAVFPAATYPASGSTTTINADYQIGTIDMSLRTSNTMTLATSTNSLGIYGNWINGTGITISGTGTIFFVGRTTQQITSAVIAFTQPITINSPSGTVTLQDAFTTGTGVTTTLTNGTLDLQSYTLSTGLFNSNNSNTRTIAFGTGQISCTGTGTVWTTATVTNLTTTGTQVVNVTSTGSTAITVTPGALSEANSISYNFTGGTYALTFLGTASHTVRNVSFTGYAGTLGAIAAGIIYGNLTLSSGMTLTASGNALSFRATSGTQQITTNTKTLDFPITFNGVGGTFQLQDALTLGSARTTTFTAGTLDLNNLTLTTGLFSSSNSNTRTIAFGTGNITCTGTGTVWNSSTVTSLTITGTPVVNVTSVGSTAINVYAGQPSEANSISFNFTGGTYALLFGYLTGTPAVRNLNFTGYAGTFTIDVGANTVVYGNLTVSSGMTVASSTATMTFGATSGTKTITTNARTLDFALITFNGVGGTFQLQDALTMGSTRTATLTNGTLDLNGFTYTVGTSFTTATGTKNLTFNGGTLVCPAATTTAFNNAAPTNFTTTAGTGTGTISMTAATAKTFVGGGSTFNCTLRQGGLGALTVTGSNTFNDITNTVQPASILFTAGTTSTFSNFSLSGTAGNLITIGSVTAASHTLSKASGTVSVSFCSISRSNATGGATWEALTANGNVDGGNNTGWSFGGVIYAAVIAEAATATDSILGRAVFNSALSEAATATDSVISFADFYAALSETATATDSVLSFADFYAALAETATATDSVLSFADFYAALAETATATDSPLVAPSTFNAPVAETVTATDAVSPPGSIYNAPVSETVTISDLVLGLFLWNLIDDSQSVTWQNINSSPGTTWSPIDTDPDTGWSVTPTVN